MLRSFILITFRILWRNKVTSFVNIFSLSVGITAFIFIMLYVQHETSYDKFHVNYDRVYRLEADDWGKLPPIFGTHLKANVPEIEDVALISCQQMWAYSIRDPQSKEVECDITLADSTTFDVFSFQLVRGNIHTALKEPGSLVISESVAKKMFGDDDPMGKTVFAGIDQLQITGVLKDVNLSHFEFDALMSASSFKKFLPDRDMNNTTASNWAWSATYLLLNKNVDPKTLETKLNEELASINDGILVDTKFNHFKLRPLKELYFFGETAKASYGLHGNFQTIIILIIIGISLLALSGTNYVNLTTAGSTTRFKEVAVKRLTGSSVGMLRVQLMGESVIISLISLGIGLTLVQLLLPKFGALTGVNVSLMRLNDSMLWLKIIGGGIVIGVLSGVYPAFFLTAIQPLLLIKERIKGTRSLFRSALMTFQFTLSVVMIVAIIVIHRQLTFVRSMDLGFDKEQVLMIHTPADIPNEFVLRQQFESRLENIPGVEGVSFSIGSLGIFLSESADMVINGEVRSGSKMLGVDEKYFDVMGLEVLEGRSFSLDSPGDSALLMTPSGARIGGILFNETAMKEYGASVGQRVYVPDGSDSAKQEPRKYFEIVGVVRDFHFQSLHEKIEPLSFIWFHKPGITASIRVSPSNIHATVGAIEAEYKNVWQAGSDYSFLDDTFNKFYARDQQLASVIDCFAVLAVIIASLGLFALSSFMVSGRMKEIGVRKVLGASVGRIYSMLSWDFLRWIVVAVLIGCPIGWYTMNAWLRTFEYRISIGMDVFAIAALLAVGIALLTITWQSINVAKANPVESLRYE